MNKRESLPSKTIQAHGPGVPGSCLGMSATSAQCPWGGWNPVQHLLLREREPMIPDGCCLATQIETPGSFSGQSRPSLYRSNQRGSEKTSASIYWAFSLDSVATFPVLPRLIFTTVLLEINCFHYSDEKKTEGCRGHKRLIQGHGTNKWPWQHSDPSSLAPELRLSLLHHPAYRQKGIVWLKLKGGYRVFLVTSVNLLPSISSPLETTPVFKVFTLWKHPPCGRHCAPSPNLTPSILSVYSVPSYFDVVSILWLFSPPFSRQTLVNLSPLAPGAQGEGGGSPLLLDTILVLV